MKAAPYSLCAYVLSKNVCHSPTYNSLPSAPLVKSPVPPVLFALFSYHISTYLESHGTYHQIVLNGVAVRFWKGERNLTAWSRPSLCPAMPQTSGGKDKVIQGLPRRQKKFPKMCTKLTSSKSTCGESERAWSSLISYIISMAPSLTVILQLDYWIKTGIMLSTATILQSREVNAEEFSTGKPGPNLQGLSSQGLAILQASFSTTNSPSQLGS